MWVVMRASMSVCIFFVTTISLVVSCQLSDESATPAVDPFSLPWQERELFRPGLIKEEQGILDELPGATVYHIDVAVDGKLSMLQGHEAVSYTNREDEPLEAIYFRLYPNTAGGRLVVSSLVADDREINPVYESQDSALRVPLSHALKPGDAIEISMDFKVEIPREMAGNYGLFGFFDDVLVLDTFYPMIPVYDEAGWHIEVPPSIGDVTFTDASFYLVRVSMPKKLTVVASGIEVGRTNQGRDQVLTYAAGPARDFYLAASKKYTLVSLTIGETVVNSYALKGHKEEAETALGFALAALQSLGERFGPYPYSEFDVLSTPMQSLGIEYPGAVGIRLNLYDPDIQTLGLPYPVVLESTVAHEVAHQWFYNIVGNDQVNEAWIDEAVVQYVTGLYYLDTYGDNAADQYRQSWDGNWARIDRAEIPIGMPSRHYSQEEYSPIVYGRGPFFVTALEAEMGSSTFASFLREYVQKHWWGIGAGETFRQLAEAHCHCDLNDLFQAWVYK